MQFDQSPQGLIGERTRHLLVAESSIEASNIVPQGDSYVSERLSLAIDAGSAIHSTTLFLG